MAKTTGRSGKKALITGASSGLGYEIAARLIKSGVSVINVSRTATDLACENILTDLTSNQSITRMMDQVRQHHQDCNLLVPCAGVLHWHPAGENPVAAIDNDLAVNLSGMIKIVDGVLPIIKKNSGDIVIIGSTSSFNTPPGSSIYCAAKHGVLGYIKALQANVKQTMCVFSASIPAGSDPNSTLRQRQRSTSDADRSEGNRSIDSFPGGFAEKHGSIGDYY